MYWHVVQNCHQSINQRLYLTSNLLTAIWHWSQKEQHSLSSWTVFSAILKVAREEDTRTNWLIDWLLLQFTTARLITNYDDLLLQCTMAWLLQFLTTVITIYDRHYNLRHYYNSRQNSCYTGRFATTTFSATQRCNIGTMLCPLETMSQQCCSGRIKVGRWNERVRAKRYDAMDWDYA